jgi:hypothetical protein
MEEASLQSNEDEWDDSEGEINKLKIGEIAAIILSEGDACWGIKILMTIVRAQECAPYDGEEWSEQEILLNELVEIDEAEESNLRATESTHSIPLHHPKYDEDDSHH